MISLTQRRIDFNELNLNNLSNKTPILNTLEKFWEGSVQEFVEYLESLGINYWEKSKTIHQLLEFCNDVIAKLNQAVVNENYGKFNHKTINFLSSKNLKEIKDFEFLTLTLDLRQLNQQESKQRIKDLFLTIHSASLIDFKEVNDEFCKLTFHKKGAFVYNEEFYLNNTRDSISLLESFKEPKDNNFIVARFLSDLAYKLKDNHIDESFSYSYGSGEKIASVEEIIYWSGLNKEEKEAEMERIKQERVNQKNIENQAKEEIKKEKSKTRDSLAQDSNTQILNNAQLPKLYTIQNIEAKEKQQEHNNESLEIKQIIEQSIQNYTQKELEKARIRLEKAQKESYEAYNDLKYSLKSGSSILEAIRVIQQKYRNEDTINFATLLFSEDILNIHTKDEEIKNLKEQIDTLNIDLTKANEELEKKDETISKWQSNFQKRSNEIEQLKYEFEQELEELKINEQKLKDLEIHSTAQEELISDLEKENEESRSINEELKTQNLTLKIEKDNLQKEAISLQEKNQKLEEKALEAVRLEGKMESMIERENSYKEQISKLETRIEMLYNKTNIQESQNQTPKRASDILK